MACTSKDGGDPCRVMNRLAVGVTPIESIGRQHSRGFNTAAEAPLFISSVTILGLGSCTAWLNGPRTEAASVLNITSSLDELAARLSDIGHLLSVMIGNDAKFRALSFSYAAPGLRSVVPCHGTPMHANVLKRVKASD